MVNYRLLNKPVEYCFRALGYATELMGIGLIAQSFADESNNPGLLLSGAIAYVGGRILERAIERQKRKDARLEQKLKEE